MSDLWIQTEITPDDLPVPDWSQVDTDPVPVQDIPDHDDDEDEDADG